MNYYVMIKDNVNVYKKGFAEICFEIFELVFEYNSNSLSLFWRDTLTIALI